MGGRGGLSGCCFLLLRRRVSSRPFGVTSAPAPREPPGPDALLHCMGAHEVGLVHRRVKVELQSESLKKVELGEGRVRVTGSWYKVTVA